MEAHLSNLYPNMLLHAVPVKAALYQEAALTYYGFLHLFLRSSTDQGEAMGNLSIEKVEIY